MNELNVLIEQMVSDIAAQACQLVDLRLRLFLDWLAAHSGRVEDAVEPALSGLHRPDTEEKFRAGLKSWLESLPVQGRLREYRLILDEIAWWRSLDLHRLSMLLKSEAGK